MDETRNFLGAEAGALKFGRPSGPTFQVIRSDGPV
jgi:hypothetical protein